MSPDITSIDQLDLNKKYSYSDYLLWKFSERIELIKGKVFKMSPAPNTNHQRISMKLTRELDRYFYGLPCELFVAPFDVRLVNFKKSSTNKQITTVVQPDLCIVCDKDKIDDRGCIGSPDLIIEILSPGNSSKEMDIKFDLYEENLVKEYWIVNPEEKTVLIYTLKGKKYYGLKPFVIENEIYSIIFPELKFQLNKIFTT
jgi:Uma2 family endonuclease